jgi:hypothetical protein
MLLPAPAYSLAQAGWIPRLLTWRDDASFDRREGQPCESWVAAMAASCGARERIEALWARGCQVYVMWGGMILDTVSAVLDEFVAEYQRNPFEFFYESDLQAALFA